MVSIILIVRLVIMDVWDMGLLGKMGMEIIWGFVWRRGLGKKKSMGIGGIRMLIVMGIVHARKAILLPLAILIVRTTIRCNYI